MPTYEYACDRCGHGFEKFQSISASRLVTCPDCGEDTLKRLIGTGGGIIFKGSGFYQTDYKNTPKNGTKGSVSDKPAAKESPAASSSDSKSGGETKASSNSSAAATSKPTTVKT